MTTKEMTVTTNSVFDLIPMTEEERAMVLADACGANLGGLDILGLQTPILKICNDKGDRMGKFVHGFNDVDCWSDLDGILIRTKSRRALWMNDLDADNPEPPDCRSNNGVTCSETTLEGIESGQMCAKCPKSQWTKDAEGKDVAPDCTLFMDMLYYLKPAGENSDPFVAQITSSPTSLKYIRKYLNSVRWSGKTSYSAFSRLEIGIDEKGKYSWFVLKPHFQATRKITPDDALAIKPFLFKKEEDVFNNDDSVLYDAATSDSESDTASDTEYIPASQPEPKSEPIPEQREATRAKIAEVAKKMSTPAQTPDTSPEISATVTITPPADVDDECPF